MPSLTTINSHLSYLKKMKEILCVVKMQHFQNYLTSNTYLSNIKYISRDAIKIFNLINHFKIITKIISLYFESSH